jgi:hypothetical protein
VAAVLLSSDDGSLLMAVSFTRSSLCPKVLDLTHKTLWILSTVYFHRQVKFGLSAIAQDTTDVDTTIVSCLFSLVIDLECSLHALTALFGDSTLADLQSWSEKAAYLHLHIFTLRV